MELPSAVRDRGRHAARHDRRRSRRAAGAAASAVDVLRRRPALVVELGKVAGQGGVRSGRPSNQASKRRSAPGVEGTAGVRRKRGPPSARRCAVGVSRAPSGCRTSSGWWPRRASAPASPGHGAQPRGKRTAGILPATGGPTATAGGGKRGRSGRPTSPSSSPPATGLAVAADDSPRQRSWPLVDGPRAAAGVSLAVPPAAPETLLRDASDAVQP